MSTYVLLYFYLIRMYLTTLQNVTNFSYERIIYIGINIIDDIFQDLATHLSSKTIASLFC